MIQLLRGNGGRMSEASRVWRVDVDGREYEIEVDHSTWTGGIEVRRNAEVVATGRLWLTARRFEVPVGTSTALVEVESAYAGFAARSELHLDGRYVEPLRG